MFIYVGKLADVVREAARLLRVGGALVFSVEAIEKTPSDATGAELPRDYRLLASGRYAHSADYLRQLARDNGFGKVDISPGRYPARKGRARARLAGDAGCVTNSCSAN